MANKLKQDWNNLWQRNNLGSTLGSLGAGFLGAFSVGKQNAQVKDTTEDEVLMDTIENTQFGSGSYDNLLSSFGATNMARTDYTADELRGLTGGQMLGNTLLGMAQGAASGKGLLDRIINVGAAGVAGITGAFVGKRKAKDKAEELNTKAEEANNRYLASFNNAVANTHNTMFNNSLLNMAAKGGKIYIKPNNLGGNLFDDGGLMHQHGGIFSNGVTFIDNGGTHEQNPFEGVQIGVDAQGIPNMVEEGEVIWQNYVFSNRLKPTKEFKDKYKVKGDTFADVAKKMQEESEERPNDPISKRGLEDSMMKLMLEQEKIRSNSERRMPNNMFDKGGKKNNKSKSDTLDTSNMINSILEHDYYVNQLGYRSVPEGKRIEKEIKFQKMVDSITGAGNSPTEIENIFSVFRKDRKYKTGRNKNNKFAWGGYPFEDESPYNYGGMSPEVVEEMLAEAAFEDSRQSGMADDVVEDIKKEAEFIAARQTGMSPEIVESTVKSTPVEPYSYETPTTVPTKPINTKSSKTKTPSTKPQTTKSFSTEYEDPETGYSEGVGNSSWLRYAPVVGSAVGVFSDLLGLTNKPDYKNTKLIQDATRRITPVSYTPIGTYLSYNPLDKNFYSSRLSEQAGATRKAIINQAINPGAAMSGLMATDYNAQTQLGGLYRQAEEYNQAQREKVAGFNRQTDAMNAEMAMRAAIANQNADELRLRAAMAQAQMREQADATASAARSANLTNLFDNLGAVGKESFIMDMIENNPDLLYSYTGKYKNSSACGGKINRKRRK